MMDLEVDIALLQLMNASNVAVASYHRLGVVLSGPCSWTKILLENFSKRAAFSSSDLAWFGHESPPNWTVFEYHQGKYLLGQSIHALVFDLALGFDANSFSAATGCLSGGGILFILNQDKLQGGYDKVWLEREFSDFLCLSEQGFSTRNWDKWFIQSKFDLKSSVPSKIIPHHKIKSSSEQIVATSEQALGIEKIQKVAFGHRKRPLVITADRGRGKTTLLGIAVASLCAQKPLSLLVTAPNFKAVEGVFSYAEKILNQSKLGVLTHRKHQLMLDLHPILSFITPDELLKTKPNCDLLMVDEAAAIPLPFLIQWVECYHRIVFSSTVHGYEGCGRGFSLKFEPFLNEHRPNWQSYQLESPIRWAQEDPLEAWLMNAFLLNIQNLPSPSSINLDAITLNPIDKSEFLANPERLKEAFSLLVSAHYQTSPNDLIQLLRDEKHHLYVATENSFMLACIWVCEEGGLELEQILAIQLGERKIKGQLVAGGLAHYFGIPEPALFHSQRVIRIAVHPYWQRYGLGAKSLMLLKEKLKDKAAYLSTSFGMTASLFSFWNQQNYVAVKLGARRDKSSGTHSIAMIQSLALDTEPMVNSLYQQCRSKLFVLARETFFQFETELLFLLLRQSNKKALCSTTDKPNLEFYAKGGSSYEAILPDLIELLPCWLNNTRLKESMHFLLIAKVIQGLSWQQTASRFGLTGRKQIELSIRNYIVQQLFSDKNGI